MKKQVKIVIVAIACLLVVSAIVVPSVLFALGYIDYIEPAVSQEGKYLLVYFSGNLPEEERIKYAVSEDGYNFSPLNNNQPVVTQTVGTGCARDPFIIRGEDGCFYLMATDMRSELGWTSNHAIVTWKSTDLINWTEETLIDLKDVKSPLSNRAWAPQAIWDEEEGMYMIYLSASVWLDENQTQSSITSIWGMYTKDFKTIEGEPFELFRAPEGKDAIDADIVKGDDGIYYMYYKDENKATICYATCDTLAGTYTAPDDNIVNVRYEGVEGNFMYRIAGTDTYVMMMDSYKHDRFYIQQTTDMVHFKRVAFSDYSFDFAPRHGAILHISDKEYASLVEAFGK